MLLLLKKHQIILDKILNLNLMKKVVFFIFFSCILNANAQCWKLVEGAFQHSIGLTDDGKLWGWGINVNGELGDNTLINKSSPVQIGNSSEWRIVSAGWGFSFGITNDGKLWAWGYNNGGYLGDNTTISKKMPEEIGIGKNWVSVNAGSFSSLALTDNQKAWTWGRIDNDMGPYSYFGLLTQALVSNIYIQQPRKYTTQEGHDANFIVLGPVNTTSYQWQVSTNNGNTFVNITDGDLYSDATTFKLMITSATIDMNDYQYRCIVNTTDCYVISNAVPLTVLSFVPQLNNPILCTTVGSTTSIGVESSSTNATYSWEYREITTANPNPVWKTISSSTAGTVYTNYTTTTLGIQRITSLPKANTQYRVTITDGDFAVTFESANLSIIGLVKPGTIASAATVCKDGNVTFTLGGYVGTSIQWQSAVNASSVFSDIDGAVGTTYTATGISSSSNLAYRAIVTNEPCGTTATTLIKTIKVDPASISGIVTGGGVVCVGGSGSVKVAGYVGKIQWEYSTGGINYFNVPKNSSIPIELPFSTTSASNTTTTYAITNITSDVYFRAKITSGLCSSTYTNAVQYVLGTVAVSGTITSVATASICKGTGTTLTLTGALGVITWEKSTNWLSASPTWISTTNHTTTLATGNLFSSTAYRAKVTIGSCSTVISDYSAVMLIPAPLAKTITANITKPTGVSTAALCNDLSVAKTFAIGVGYVGAIQWQRSTISTATGFVDIAGETNPTYVVSNPALGVNYYRVKLTNSCGVSVFSAAKAVWYKDCGIAKQGATPILVRDFDVIASPNPYNENFNLSLSTSSEEKCWNYSL